MFPWRASVCPETRVSGKAQFASSLVLRATDVRDIAAIAVSIVYSRARVALRLPRAAAGAAVRIWKALRGYYVFLCCVFVCKLLLLLLRLFSFARARACVLICRCKRVQMRIYIYIYIYMRINICLYARVRACMHVCLSV